MEDHIFVEPGALPWQPSATSDLAATYHFYDRPLVGVVEQGEAAHIFRCVAGEMEDWNLWAYFPLRAEERALLDDASDFDSVLESVTSKKAATIALAREGLGVISSAVAQHADEIPSVGGDLVLRALADYAEAALAELRGLNIVHTAPRTWLQTSDTRSSVPTSSQGTWRTIASRLFGGYDLQTAATTP